MIKRLLFTILLCLTMSYLAFAQTTLTGGSIKGATYSGVEIAPPASDPSLLLESGDYLLLENGDKLLLE